MSYVKFNLIPSFSRHSYDYQLKYINENIVPKKYIMDTFSFFIHNITHKSFIIYRINYYSTYASAHEGDMIVILIELLRQRWYPFAIRVGQ